MTMLSSPTVRSWVNKLSRFIDRITTVTAILAGGAIAVLFLLIVTEIALRNLLGESLLFTVEVSGWLLVSICFLGGAYALKRQSHIRLTLLTSHLSPTIWFWLNSALHIVGMVVFSWFAVLSWRQFSFCVARNILGESLPHLPLFVPWMAVFLGSAVFALQHIGSTLENLSAYDASPLEPTGKGSRKNWWIVVLIVLMLLGLIAVICFTPPTNSLVLLCLLIGLILAAAASGLWIYLSLFVVGIFVIAVFANVDIQRLVPLVSFGATNSFVLACMPLFILMGELLLRSGASDDLYSGISPLVERLPGRLLHSNVIACSIFAAVSGSSAATTAFVASVAIPALRRRAYDRRLALASLAGAGTLGLLIPPSIMMIVYGAVAAQSVGQLFLAGFLPGITIAGLFSLYIIARALRNPQLAPPGPTTSLRQGLVGSVRVLPILVAIVVVLGSIYTGVATPTEAAALGVFMALAINVLYRRTGWKDLRDAVCNTIATSSMVLFITTGAILLSVALGYVGIPQRMAEFVLGLNLSKWAVFAILCVVYLCMGCFFDGVSMILLTVPIILPTITALGFDLIWFGIVLTILIEVAQVTPPVGINLFVLQNMSGEKIEDIARWSFPFFIILNIGILILVLFPDLALFLPATMAR